MKPTIVIEYCPKCNWLLRAAYIAQELLTTFTDDVYGITLQPAKQPAPIRYGLAGNWYSIVNNRVVFLK